MEVSCDFICHKINRSVGTIAKMRYYISRHLLLIYIMHLSTYLIFVKIKPLLLNVLGYEDNYLNVNY